MKAISIRQPWAWLIVHGYQDVENRTWSTKHRGPILIHCHRVVRSAWLPCGHIPGLNPFIMHTQGTN